MLEQEGPLTIGTEVQLNLSVMESWLLAKFMGVRDIWRIVLVALCCKCALGW